MEIVMTSDIIVDPMYICICLDIFIDKCIYGSDFAIAILKYR